MFPENRVFYEDDPDAPTTRAVQLQLEKDGRFIRGSRKHEGAEPNGPPGGNVQRGSTASERAPTPGVLRAASNAPHVEATGASSRFTTAERALIRKIHRYVPPAQMLQILNDRRKGDLGPSATPCTIEHLHHELAGVSGASAPSQAGWSGLRKLLAQAKRDGTLAKVNEQVVTDFAVVFLLSPKQLMQLKDILLQQVED